MLKDVTKYGFVRLISTGNDYINILFTRNFAVVVIIFVLIKQD